MDITLRDYRPADLYALEQLFYETVHTVNAADYTPEQLDAWAPGSIDRERWNRTLTEHFTRIALIGDRIVGFGDLADDGYLDRLYVHRHFQQCGVATAICDALERRARLLGSPAVITHASVTALLFLKDGATA